MKPILIPGYFVLQPITACVSWNGRSKSADLFEDEKTDIEPQIQLLYKFIAELSEIDRIIISLELEEVRQADIAQIIGLSESNVRVRIHRIKVQLTRKFKEYGE